MTGALKHPISKSCIWSERYDQGCSTFTLHLLLVKTRTHRGNCHTLRSRCACVRYIVANLFLLCSFECISLCFEELKNYTEAFKIMSYHCFSSSFSFFKYLPIFIFFFYFCIAQVFFCNRKLIERY